MEIYSKIEAYAETILNILDVDADSYNVRRGQLLDLLIDTLQAREQWKIQEE